MTGKGLRELPRAKDVSERKSKVLERWIRNTMINRYLASKGLRE